MGLNALAGAFAARGALAEAEYYMDKQLDICTQVGDPVAIAFVEASRAGLLFDIGRWGESREGLTRAAGLIAPLGPCWASPYVLIFRGPLALATGDDAEGQPDDARAYLRPLADALESLGTFGPTVLHLLAWTALDLDDLQVAGRLIIRALDMCRERNDRLVLVDALVVRARLAARRGEPEARSMLAEALTQAHAITYPYGLARALYASALLHEQYGDGDRAMSDYTEALDILHALGEQVYAPRIERALSNRSRFGHQRRRDRARVGAASPHAASQFS